MFSLLLQRAAQASARIGFAALLIGISTTSQAQNALPPTYGIGYPTVGPNGGLNQPGYKTTATIIAETKALGANAVRVTVTAGLYDSPNSNASNKTLTAQNSPTDADLTAHIRALKDAGLKVVLVPFANTVAGTNILSGTVRTPTDINAFMADHTANHVRMARIAQATGVDSFVAFLDDTEGLVRQPANAALWVNHINQIRAVYSGAIIAAPGTSGQLFDGGNTHFELIPRAVMDAADVVGCTCYFNGELVATNETTAALVEAGFRGANNGIDVLALYEYASRAYGKPLILSDTSYHSYDGSAREITKIYDANIPLTVDAAEQAHMFDGHLAVLKNMRGKDWFQGITFSGQNALPDGAIVARFLKSVYGEDIAGKPAESIVRNWFTGVFPVAAQTPRSTAGNVTGGDGDDVITLPSGGTRTINGGRGTNTVALGMNVRDVNISGSFLSAQVTASGVALTLNNIHFIRFNDATVELATGKSSLSSVAGVQTITGSTGSEFIKAGTANQTIVPGGSNDIVIANPWYQQTVRMPVTLANASYGTQNGAVIITANPNTPTTRYWVRTLGAAKIEFADQTVTLAGQTVAGTALQTNLYGNPGNDTFTTLRAGKAVSIAGSAGNDSIEGGSSTVTVVYPERRANFTITRANGVTTVVKPNGTDTLRNVASLQFSDETLSLTTPPAAGRNFGPVFSSASTASQSFLRVNNTGVVDGSVSATLRNPSTGAVLGTWTSPGIPANASAQFLINTIESAIPANVPKPSSYAVTLNGALAGSTQHVLYRPVDGTLTNLSTCEASVTAAPTQLINVHSSLLDYGFPSTIVIANTGSTATTATLGVYDSLNGTKLGVYTTAAVAANGQLRLPIATLQTTMGFTPSTSQFHYNIRLESAFTGYLQHLVNNLSVGVVTDMTTTCGLAATDSTQGAVPRLTSIYSSAQPASQSFLRFHNTGGIATSASLTLFNADTGAALAQWTSPIIEAGASAQFVINTIENASNAQFTKPQFYSVQVVSDMQGYVQHVLYRPADGTLTNLSTCSAGVTANPTELINVHSTILEAGFPSSVVLNNTSAAVVNSVTLGIYDSTNGTKLATYTTAAVPANGQLSVGTAAIEAATGIKPGTTIYHYNIKVESDFTGFLQHLVNNITKGVITDMTTTCKLN